MTTYDRKDRLYNLAKEEGYRARSAFKLMELNKRFRFFKGGARVIDLGSFPGGWVQVACEQVGERGVVVGIDLKPLQPFTAKDFPNAKGSPAIPKVFVGDITSLEVQNEVILALDGEADVVLSDMSPHLSGIKSRDIAQAVELVEAAFHVAERLLKQNGTFVAKIFPSPETDQMFKRISPSFAKIQRVCLDSTRKTSNEYYIVGTGFRNAN